MGDGSFFETVSSSIFSSKGQNLKCPSNKGLANPFALVRLGAVGCGWRSGCVSAQRPMRAMHNLDIAGLVFGSCFS